MAVKEEKKGQNWKTNKKMTGIITNTSVITITII